MAERGGDDGDDNDQHDREDGACERPDPTKRMTGP
jgi:hypothetical protein